MDQNHEGTFHIEVDLKMFFIKTLKNPVEAANYQFKYILLCALKGKLFALNSYTSQNYLHAKRDLINYRQVKKIDRLMESVAAARTPHIRQLVFNQAKLEMKESGEYVFS